MMFKCAPMEKKPSINYTNLGVYGLILLLGFTFFGSFNGIKELASETLGWHHDWLLPIIIDLVLIVITIMVLSDKKQGESATTNKWISFVFTLLTIWANGVLYWKGWGLSEWTAIDVRNLFVHEIPPIAFFALKMSLAQRLGRDQDREKQLEIESAFKEEQDRLAEISKEGEDVSEEVESKKRFTLTESHKETILRFANMVNEEGEKLSSAEISRVTQIPYHHVLRVVRGEI